MKKGLTPKRKSPDWRNQTLDDEEELMPPNLQIQAEQFPDHDDDRIGGKVKALALELSRLVGEKLPKRAPIELLENVAMAACEADVSSWGDLVDLTDVEREI